MWPVSAGLTTLATLATATDRQPPLRPAAAGSESHCLRLCVAVSNVLSLYLSLCVAACRSVTVCHYMCVSESASLCVCLCVSESASLCVCMVVRVSVWVAVSVGRRRALALPAVADAATVGGGGG